MTKCSSWIYSNFLISLLNLFSLNRRKWFCFGISFCFLSSSGEENVSIFFQGSTANGEQFIKILFFFRLKSITTRFGNLKRKIEEIGWWRKIQSIEEESNCSYKRMLFETRESEMIFFFKRCSWSVAIDWRVSLTLKLMLNNEYWHFLCDFFFLLLNSNIRLLTYQILFRVSVSWWIDWRLFILFVKVRRFLFFLKCDGKKRQNSLDS